MRKGRPEGLALLINDRPVEAFEQLDVALRIVSARQGLLLAALLGTLGAFLVFSCLYRAPLKVEGRGIILPRYENGVDPLLQVTAPAAGRLSRVLVKIGDTIDAQAVIGEIDQRDLVDEIETVTAELVRLTEEDRKLTEFEQAEAASMTASLTELERTLLYNIRLDKGRLAQHRVILARDASLRERQMISDLEAMKDRAEADAVDSAVANNQARVLEMKYEGVKDDLARRRDKLKRGFAADAARTKIDILRARLLRDSRIISDDAGTVVDLMITPHAPVEKGAPAALLRPRPKGRPPLEAIVFVPAGPGKKVRKDAMVEVAPDTVRRQEHGFIRGSVISISEIPATEQAMRAELKHPALVQSFLSQYAGQVLLNIHVDLRELHDGHFGPGADRRFNRLEWSSRSGGFQRLDAGTLCAASVVVEERPLITLAFPWLRALGGFD